MFIERGFTVKESKECGANGTMVSCLQCRSALKSFLTLTSQALLTLPDPEEALRALAVMHNYAPEGYKVSFSRQHNNIICFWG